MRESANPLLQRSEKKTTEEISFPNSWIKETHSRITSSRKVKESKDKESLKKKEEEKVEISHEEKAAQ